MDNLTRKAVTAQMVKDSHFVRPQTMALANEIAATTDRKAFSFVSDGRRYTCLPLACRNEVELAAHVEISCEPSAAGCEFVALMLPGVIGSATYFNIGFAANGVIVR